MSNKKKMPEAEEKTEQAEVAAEVNPLEAELNEAKEKYLRLLAEYDNYRKRTQKEKECTYIDAVADTVTMLLPILDNLQRAVEAPEQDIESFKSGVNMILKQFVDVLYKLGCEEIPTDCAFDPTFHQAVSHVSDENSEENSIIEVYQKGHKIKDKVLRHAMVKVAN